MGERLLCKQEVIGSIPFTSTTDFCAAKCQAASAVALATARAAARGNRAAGQGLRIRRRSIGNDVFAHGLRAHGRLIFDR